MTQGIRLFRYMLKVAAQDTKLAMALIPFCANDMEYQGT